MVNSTTDAIPMTEKEYLSMQGVGDISSGYTIDKLRGNRQLRTQKGRERFEKELLRAEDLYREKKQAAQAEYRELINNGMLRDKTPIEKSLERAHGHPDNESTQAARRMLEKRGIDWRTGERLIP